MRASLLFSLRWFAPVLVLAAVCWMLAVPCLPLSDPAGQAMAVPRWEFWLIVASVPSTIAWQWTGGLDSIVWTDRLPLFAWAGGWLLASGLVGWPLVGIDGHRMRRGRIERGLLSILVGYPILGFLVFANGSLLGLDHQQPWLSMVMVVSTLIVTGSLWWMRSRLDSHVEDDSNRTDAELSQDALVDPSFRCAMYRRLVGLFVLGLIWLGGVQIYGSTIPSQDHEVRETSWWLAKHSVDDQLIRVRYDNLLANGPSLEAMPIVATTCLHSSLSRLWTSHSTRKTEQDATQVEQQNEQLRLLASRQLGALTGKVLQASLGIIGLGLLGLHLARRFGILPSLLACFLIVATPGISELVRFGRAEFLVGVWLAAWLICYLDRRESGIQTKNFVGWFLLAGLCSLSYSAMIVIALPAVGFALWERRSREVSTRWNGMQTIVCLFAVLISIAVPLRNTIVMGDPLFPWLTVLVEPWLPSQNASVQPSQTAALIRNVYRIPSETIAEQLQSAQQEQEGMSLEPTGESISESKRPSTSPYRIANAIDGISRLLWNSTAHGLLLIPLAVVGLCAWRDGQRHRLVLIPAICFLGWGLAWWGFTPRWDRDWVGMLILLAWPAAMGTRWFIDRVHSAWLGILGVVVLCWSVLVIPVWPMSDNRLLVAIDEIRSSDPGAKGASANSPRTDKPDIADSETDAAESNRSESRYVDVLNRYLVTLPASQEVQLAVIGELDDFDIIAKTISCDRFDAPSVVSVSEMDAVQCRQYLSKQSVSHVVIVWSGVLALEKLTHVSKEQKYRRLIDELNADGTLKRVDWEMNPSVAELFEVNNQ